MITRIYEITCDYCCAAIYHGLGSKHLAIQQMLNCKNPGVLYKGRHFCDNECLENWKRSKHHDILGNKT